MGELRSRHIDISVPLGRQVPVWPGDPSFEVTRFLRIETGDTVNASQLLMSVHTGTHIDAPLHFLPGGGDVEGIALDRMIGPCVVADLPGVGPVDVPELESANIQAGAQRLLLKTSNSTLWAARPGKFVSEFRGLTGDAARWIIERGVGLLGVDYLSVQGFEDTEPTTHTTLLGAGVVILEGLDLSEVAAGPYELVCLPLRLLEAEGAPARAILLPPVLPCPAEEG